MQIKKKNTTLFGTVGLGAGRVVSLLTEGKDHRFASQAWFTIYCIPITDLYGCNFVR